MLKKIKNLFSSIRHTMPSASRFHIEADRSRDGLRVLVGGVRSVLSYRDGEIVLKTVIGEVRIVGHAISISVYDDKTVSLSGMIEEVQLAYSKN